MFRPSRVSQKYALRQMRLVPAALTVSSRSAGRVFSLWACPPFPYRPRGRPRWASGGPSLCSGPDTLGCVTPRLLDGSIQVKRGCGFHPLCPSRVFSLAALHCHSSAARPLPCLAKDVPFGGCSGVGDRLSCRRGGKLPCALIRFSSRSPRYRLRGFSFLLSRAAFARNRSECP